MRYCCLLLIVLTSWLAGCQDKAPSATQVYKPTRPASTVVKIAPGPGVQDELLTALIKAKPGTIIELAAGQYEFTASLSLTVSGVTLRGAGIDQTILSFAKQDQGKEGLKVEASDFLMHDLTIEDAKGDNIKVLGGNHITFRNIKTWWSRGPKETNGGYGLYPVQCTNVLIEGCIAECASDAGIYVGQSTNVIVRKCKASRNVAGIEIENCIHAEVTECSAFENAGGILVFDMPNLPVKNGKMVRVYKNNVEANNHANFAPKGNIVATVPPGTGMMILAMDQVEMFDNQIRHNQTTGIAILSFQLTQKEITDKAYDSYPEGLYIHDNTFAGNGTKPAGDLGTLLGSVLGKPLPDIVYDGNSDPKKMVNGKTPDHLGLKLNNNGQATFINLHYDGSSLLKFAASNPKFERDAQAYTGTMAGLPAVEIK